MNRLARFFAGALVPALVLAGASTNQAMAQEKAKATPKYEQKVFVDNEKVRATETRWAPGGESPSVARPYRVLRVLKGGTLERIYPDGKKEKVTRKTGEVYVQEASQPYSVKNVGRSEVVLYGVSLK